jgi:hypothetical protein
LTDAGIDHAFGGALCLGYHVESPRATVDIDVNVTAEPRDAARVLRALPARVAFNRRFRYGTTASGVSRLGASEKASACRSRLGSRLSIRLRTVMTGRVVRLC